MRDVTGRNFAWIHGGIYIACDRTRGPKFGSRVLDHGPGSNPAPCVTLQGNGCACALCPACSAFVWHWKSVAEAAQLERRSS